MRNEKKHLWLKLLLLLAGTIAAAWLLTFWVIFTEGQSGISFSQIRSIPTREPFFLFLSLSGFLLFSWAFQWKRAWEFIFRFRFLLAVLLLIFLTVLGVNGSSLGIWHRYFGQGAGTEIFGRSQLMRSDEWALFTPMALSQYKNPLGAFSYFNEILRGTKTDMFLLYGQPVKDIGILWKPYDWGYLFLPAANGLAWFWCGRAITLALVSFEFGRLITDDKRLLSAAFAALVVWAPTVSWWFSINGLVEMIIDTELSILLFQRYLSDQRTLNRALCGAGIFFAAGNFLLTIYPAWMVPFGYILLGLIIWTILSFRKNLHFSGKDLVILAAELLLFAAVFLHIARNSMEELKAIMNTEYPGKRVDLGGEGKAQIGNYFAAVWFGVHYEAPNYNPCDASQFLGFFPLSWILPFVVLIREKKRDLFLLCLCRNTG